MLFRKKIQRYCTYCAFGCKLDEDCVMCRKCGVVPAEHHCRRFRYDPLKRVPPKHQALTFEQYRDADFSL